MGSDQEAPPVVTQSLQSAQRARVLLKQAQVSLTQDGGKRDGLIADSPLRSALKVVARCIGILWLRGGCWPSQVAAEMIQVKQICSTINEYPQRRACPFQDARCQYSHQIALWKLNKSDVVSVHTRCSDILALTLFRGQRPIRARCDEDTTFRTNIPSSEQQIKDQAC